MHRFLAQPIVMTDFGGHESLGELLSTLSQLEATVNQVLSQISGRVEEEKQKVDAVGVRLDSCRGRLHGLAQERYNKATVVTSPSRYPAPAQLPQHEVLFRSSHVSSPVTPGDNAFGTKKSVVTGLPHLSLKSTDPFSLDDAVGLCFDKEQQPTKKSNLRSDDVKVDAARLHGLTSVSDLLVFSPGDHQNRRAAAPLKSRQLSLDQKLGAAPATISGDVAWDMNVVPMVDLRHHPVMAPIRLRAPRNLTGLSMVAQDIAFVDKQERSEGDEIDEDLPLPEFADDKYFPSKIVRAPLNNGSRQAVGATSDLVASPSAQAFPTAEATAAGGGVVPFPAPEVVSHAAIDQLPEFDLAVPPRPTTVDAPNNNRDAGRALTAPDGAQQPAGCCLLPIPPPLPDVPAVKLPFTNELMERSAAWAQRFRPANVPQPPVAPPAPANALQPCVVRDARSAQAVGREEAQQANNANVGDDQVVELSVPDILRNEFVKRGFDVANGRTLEEEEEEEEEGAEWEEKDDEWLQHEVDHEAVASIRSFF